MDSPSNGGKEAGCMRKGCGTDNKHLPVEGLCREHARIDMLCERHRPYGKLRFIEQHPYEMPEMTVISIVTGSGEYLELMHIELGMHEMYMPSTAFTLYPTQDIWCFL